MAIVASAAMPAEVSDEARGMVSRIRDVMSRDICEYEMADLARALNKELNEQQEAFDEAWDVIESHERAAWKRLLIHRRPVR